MTWRERFARFRSFWIFPCLATVLLWWSTRQVRPDGLLDLYWLFPLGVFLWSLIEYGLHRFCFHREIRHIKFRRIVGGTHVQHHEAPRDPDQLLVRVPYALLLSLPIYTLLLAVTRDWFHATGIMSGIWTGFLYYEWVHYRVHLTLGSGGLISMQRRAHFYHHFRNPDRCFGVTTPVWDYVFGTRRSRD